MKVLTLILLLSFSLNLYAQIGPDGTGTVSGYYIGPGADLSNADLSNADLSGADLSGASLFDANLSDANLSDADLSGANLFAADLTGANLRRVLSGSITGAAALPNQYQLLNGYIVGPYVNLSDADLSGATLRYADLTYADLSGANLSGANLFNTNLTDANLFQANLSGANLYNANLPDADLSFADLSDANLSGANLSEADLSSANFNGVRSGGITGTPTFTFSGYYRIVNGYIIGPYVNLSGARLISADLLSANLRYTDLSDADLSGADITNANLSGANLSGANLSGANLGSTIWSDVISQTEYNELVDARDIAISAQATAETARDTALAAKATAEMERDSRPTQAAYNAVVAERDARLTEKEVRDLRLGSRMLEVVDGDATINIELEATDNLGITSPTWKPVPESKVIIHPNYQSGKIRIDVGADDASNSGIRFFRFKMAE